MEAWAFAFGGLALVAALWAMSAVRLPRRLRQVGLPVLVTALAAFTVVGTFRAALPGPAFPRAE